MSEWMIFAERLSEQIKKQNLSIRQLAERMDMTPTTIFRYAKGQRVPRANEILKASDVLGVTCDYLVGLSDDPKKTSIPSAQPEHKIQFADKDHVWIDSRQYISLKRLQEIVTHAKSTSLIERIRGGDGLAPIYPSAQPERKTGKWIQNDNGTYSCSVCQSWIPEEQHFYARYCLYCGADMRGKDDDEERS